MLGLYNVGSVVQISLYIFDEVIVNEQNFQFYILCTMIFSPSIFSFFHQSLVEYNFSLS